MANPALSRTSGLTYWVAPPTGNTACPSVIVDVTSLSVGAIGANTLSSNLANPADSVASNSTWTAAATKYLSASTVANYVIRSLCACRDQEVTTWTRQGYVYLRLDNAASGDAIYFFHNGETANGTLEVGIVTSLTEASYPSGTYYPLYSNTNCTGTITGYTLANTDGQAFTFGVSGFDIYAKYNGVEFMRFKEYRQMNGGQVAIKSQAGFGFRTITVSPLSSAFLYSNYTAGQLDLRDWNVRSIQTTGTISSGSGSLAIAARQDFKVGDWVIVEIGAEAGAGVRGTVGVGGTWPSLSYATSAIMAGSTTNAVNTYAWVTGTGNVYQWTGALWSSATFSGRNPIYYNSKAIPFSLHGRITAISGDGLTLTLDNTAVATATNANVYLDNQPYINYLTGQQQGPGFYGANDLTPITPANVNVRIPAGSYAGSGVIRVAAQQAWTVSGAGQANTTLFAPKGVYSLNFWASGGAGSYTGHTISDFTLQGNWGLNGFGLAISSAGGCQGWTYVPGGLTATGLMAAGSNNIDAANPYYITETNFPAAGTYPWGILLNANDCVAQDLTINDVSQQAVTAQTVTNAWAYRCTNNQNSEQQDYIQWQFQWSAATGGGFVDCTVNSTYMIQGFECFQCIDTQMVRCVGNNAGFSANDSQGWLYDDATLTISSGRKAVAWSPTNPLVSININAGSGNTSSGGTIRSMDIVVQGYIDANNDVPAGIVVSTGNPKVTISSGSYRAPNYSAPGVPNFGPMAIISEGEYTTVDQFTAYCTTLFSTANFNIATTLGSCSTVSNCRAGTIRADYQSGNSTCVP